MFVLLFLSIYRAGVTSSVIIPQFIQQAAVKLHVISACVVLDYFGRLQPYAHLPSSKLYWTQWDLLLVNMYSLKQ